MTIESDDVYMIMRKSEQDLRDNLKCIDGKALGMIVKVAA